MKPTPEQIIDLAREAGIVFDERAMPYYERFATLLLERFGAGSGESVAWIYTLEYGSSIADRKVSLERLRYPFGVCGSDYLRVNDNGMSYVRETPLLCAPKE